MYQACRQIKIAPFACILQEWTCKCWWWGKALRTCLGKELSLDWEMSGPTFAPALNPTALKRHYEHPDVVLWPKVISLFLIKDKAYFHFNHSFFQVRDFTWIAPYWNKWNWGYITINRKYVYPITTNAKDKILCDSSMHTQTRHWQAQLQAPFYQFIEFVLSE